jgi:hypothetical protein
MSSVRSSATGRLSRDGSVPPAKRSLRTRRFVTGGDPGRVSPIFGFAGGGAGGPWVRTFVTSAASAASSSCSSSAAPTTAMAVCRPRPPREPRRRRRDTFVIAPSGVNESSGVTAPSGPPLVSGPPVASRELSGTTGAQSRSLSPLAGFSSPSWPNPAGPELALPAAPSTGSDIEAFPSNQACSGARRAHVATRTSDDIPGRAAGSQLRAVTPYV